MNKPLGDPVKHYWLVQDMAHATGIDLAGAADRGLLTTEAWSDVVQNCRGCAWERAGGCSRWLQNPEADHTDVPGACENKDALDRLR